ncbi:esterase [Caballeronia megalochromosomata]|nr:esterase [Caballeronia megalochromosomata]
MKQPEKRRTVALLIHGLGGTEHDLGILRKSLNQIGIDTHALSLPGHGSSPEDLIMARAEQWINVATREYDMLAGTYETVHLIGMCMGALLALIVAERRPRDGKLVLLAAPVFLDGWSMPFYRRLRYFLYLIPCLARRMRVTEQDPYGIKNALTRSLIKARFQRGDAFHYRWVPLACIRQVDRLRYKVWKVARHIRHPTLVINSREDEVTSVKSASFLVDAIPTSRCLIVENSYHMLCIDNDRKQIAETMTAFLGN